MLLDALTGLADPAAAWREKFPARLAHTAESAWRSLKQKHPSATLPSLAMPRAFAEWLGAALALEDAEPASDGRGAHLAAHYLDFMPRLRVEQLATAAAPNAALFHTTLDWRALPRTTKAIDRLFAIFGSDGESALGARDAETFRAARPTLAALYERAYYGGFMPLLYGYPSDLAAIARALDGGAPLPQVIDRHLAAPLVHELSHLAPARAAIAPPYLDECLAAWLGVRALPESAWPAPNEQHALFAAPWLAQTGQALQRCFPSVLRAHAGLVPWADALPAALLDRALRLGWDEYRGTRDAHFLTSTHRPEPWVKLFYLAASNAPLDDLTPETLTVLPWSEITVADECEADRAILDDALRAMCVRNFQVELAYRTERAAPRRPIEIDLATCRVATDGNEGGCDAFGLAYLFPPSTAARLRERGISGYTVELSSLDALDEIARAISDGAASRRGDGYALTRRGV